MQNEKNLYIVFFTIALLFAGCSNVKETLDPRITEELKKHNWEYSSTDTTYESTYESEYWDYLNDRYEKMFYEAALNADFSDSIQKHVYLFYGDETNDFSMISLIKAIQFARYDHPELELMNMNFRNGSSSSSEEGCVYQSVSFYSMEYDEYSKKLNEVNSEIKNLVEQVNNTEDIIEKHLLIFNWITSNVNYIKTDEEIGNVDFYDEKFILARMQTTPTQNIYGAIVNKAAICDGIADAYKYICNMCNLECIIVNGYISEFSMEMYHAWNLVKVYDTWYLVDATWDLGQNYSDYFMVADLNKGNRTPFDIGYNLPGYTNVIHNEITFNETAETNILTTENGIIFDLVDSNYSMHVYNDTIYTHLSSLALEKYSEIKEDISENILIKTNAEITSIEYYSYKESLLKVVTGINNSDIVFPNDLDGTYVYSININLSFNGNTYQVKFKKSGA